MSKSLEERMEIAKSIIFNETLMLMTDPIKRGTIRNKDISGCCTGYMFDIDNLSYRGVWVSTIESIKVTLNGEEVPESSMLFCLKDLKIPVSNLGGHSEVFWGAENRCTLSINRIGGLGKGEHTLKLHITRRPDFGHSYGEGTEGYEDALEFLNPEKISDSITFSI